MKRLEISVKECKEEVSEVVDTVTALDERVGYAHARGLSLEL